jgi:hypothetical protein
MKNKIALAGLSMALVGVLVGTCSLFVKFQNIDFTLLVASVILGFGLMLGLISLKRQPKTLSIHAILFSILGLTLFLYCLL